jgi:hypothetical protein
MLWCRVVWEVDEVREREVGLEHSKVYTGADSDKTNDFSLQRKGRAGKEKACAWDGR